MQNAAHINGMIRHGPCNWTSIHPAEREPFSFEDIDLFWWQELMHDNWIWSVYAGVIYIVTIFGLQRWMANRPAMNLQTPLFWWNFGLGLFSTVGFVRTAPGLINTMIKPNGFYTIICRKNWLDMSIGFWTIMFILSKFVELGDTIFIVLRKRKLIFLQWYHHLVTMNISWALGSMLEPVTIPFLVFNYGVHALMYPYFALMAIGFKIPKRYANIITALQFTQMIVGFAANAISTYYYQIGEDCARTDVSVKAYGILYGVFIILFGKLFFDQVLFKSGKRKKNLAGDIKYNNNAKRD